jgi:HD-GYP domain-containing protein (c-di-GMP phosphodiesterase class II)
MAVNVELMPPAELRDWLLAVADGSRLDDEVDVNKIANILFELPAASRTAEATDALTFLARVLRNAGRTHVALAVASRAVEWADALAEPFVLFRARGTQADLLKDAGRHAESAAARVQTWEIARGLNDPLRELSAVGNIGILLDALGQFEAAMAYYERAREIAEQHGFEDFEFHSRSNLAYSAVQLGDAGAGFRALSKKRKSRLTTRLDFELACNTEDTLARLYLLVDDIESAESHAREAGRLASVAGIQRSSLVVRGLQALIDVKCGNVEEGLDALDDVLRLTRADQQADLPKTLQMCIDAYEEAGQTQRALHFLQELVALRRTLGNQVVVGLPLDRPADGPETAMPGLHAERALHSREASLRADMSRRVDLLRETAINTGLAAGYDLYRTLRVAKLARSVGSALQWEEERVTLVALGAELCDVGMVAIPTRILRKSDELAGGERHVMQDHTRFGAELLRRTNLKDVESLALIAEQHHERWDGSGYPAGLSRDQISVEARVVAVCDAFDEMRHPRFAASAALSVQATLRAIAEEAGTRFDPVVVEALTRFVSAQIELGVDVDAYLRESADEPEYVRTRLRMEKALADRKR